MDAAGEEGEDEAAAAAATATATASATSSRSTASRRKRRRRRPSENDDDDDDERTQPLLLAASDQQQQGQEEEGEEGFVERRRWGWRWRRCQRRLWTRLRARSVRLIKAIQEGACVRACNGGWLVGWVGGDVGRWWGLGGSEWWIGWGGRGGLLGCVGLWGRLMGWVRVCLGALCVCGVGWWGGVGACHTTLGGGLDTHMVHERHWPRYHKFDSPLFSRIIHAPPKQKDSHSLVLSEKPLLVSHHPSHHVSPLTL
jgi:hypothetical protein